MAREASPYPQARTDTSVVGIDIGGTNIDVALADGTGAVLHRVRLATLADQGPDQALERVVATVQDLTHRSRTVHGLAVTGHAAVVPGVVQEDRILLAPNLPGWERLGLAAWLGQALAVPDVAVSNDVRAGALAELRFGALRDADPGVYVGLGTGIAAALTVGNRVVDGVHQAAGEIGYCTLSVGAGPTAADGRAPLEELVGGRALGERASRVLGRGIDAEALFASDEPAAHQLVNQAVDALATAVANIAVFVDPVRVVVGGGLMGSAGRILPALTAHLRRAVPFPPDVRAAHFTEDASLHGAIALALDAAHAHPVVSERTAGDRTLEATS